MNGPEASTPRKCGSLGYERSNSLVPGAPAPSVQQLYPQAVPVERFLDACSRVLEKEGFTADNTLALISQCRDELCAPLHAGIGARWGSCFNIGSLAGMVCGRTAFQAGLTHSPDGNGVERYVFFAGPHIGLAHTVGAAYRIGRQRPSGACGALLGVLTELEETGGLDTDNGDDWEQMTLKRGLVKRLSNPECCLVQLTAVTHDCTLQNLRESINTSVDRDNSHHAIVTGTLIHGPDGTTFFEPQTLEVVHMGGEPVDLLPSLFQDMAAGNPDAAPESDTGLAQPLVPVSLPKPHRNNDRMSPWLMVATLVGALGTMAAVVRRNT